MCWHRWSSWYEIDRGMCKSEGKLIGVFLLQERVCDKCGKKQWNPLEWSV